MESFFCLLSFFNCEKRNFWLRQIKVLLVVLTLANISCANRRLLEKSRPTNISQYRLNPYIDPSCRTCGISNKGGREFVRGGTRVQPPYKYPWMVALFKYGGKFCGGAIISNDFILTAAHCVKQYEHQPHIVRIGFVTNTEQLRPIVSVRAIYCHPQYSESVSGLYDIALIRLRKKITCDKYKSPICLPQDNVILPPSTHLELAGWGAFYSHGPDHHEYPDGLLEGSIQTSACNKCLGMFDMRKCKAGVVYCVTEVRHQAACYGDSGSPMFLRKGGKYYIYGITSGGDKKCRQGKPFVFAAVSTSRSWIRHVAGI